MKRNIYIIISSFVITSCSTSSIVTTNLRDLTTFEDGAPIYALPQTRILVDVTAERTVFVPGPYNKYAKEFLGIEGASGISATSWEITDINLSSLNEPDPEHFYSVKNVNNQAAYARLSELIDNGLLLKPCSENNFQLSNSEILREVKEIPFTDLAINTLFFEENQKKPKNVLVDSAYATIPSLETQLQPKSEKEKAFEAAQFIFKIRKRRFKMVSGQYEVFPEGVALKASIEELDKLENEYLSLFIGKNFTSKVSKIVELVPSGSEQLQRYTLFNFSSENGFNTSTQNEGIPIIMEVKDLNQNELLNNLQMPDNNNSATGFIFYRLPDKGLINILYNSHILLEAELPVYQFGAIVPSGINQKKQSNIIVK